MTTKPRLFKPIPGSTYRGVVAALPDDIKVAALSLPDFQPWVVAALIAEGGETIDLDVGYDFEDTTGRIVGLDPGRYLVYGPVPVESAEAKET